MKNKLITAVALICSVFVLTILCYADTPTEMVDEETGMYSYLLSNGKGIHSTSSLLGTVQSVWVSADEGVNVLISREGENIVYNKGSLLSENGKYAIVFSSEGESAEILFTLQTSNETVLERTLAPSYDGNGAFSESGISVNAFDGEIINYPFVFSAPDYLLSGERDGEIFSVPENGIVSGEGSYNLTFTAIGKTLQVYHLGFTIITQMTNKAEYFYPPDGCTLTGCTLDGEAFPFGGYVSMSRDGRYDITYQRDNDEVKLSRTTTLVRDIVAPKLRFNNSARLTYEDSVSVSANEECEITVTKDGMNYNMTDHTLKGTGVYRVTAEDGAGNVSSYRITIRAISAFNPVTIIIATGVLLALGIAYFIYNKNHLPHVR